MNDFIDKVFNMDCMEGLKMIPDKCVDCCVTSPPYYALRDYGTGVWVGGDDNCDHEQARLKTRFDYDISDLQKGSKGTDVKRYSDVCPKCGAVRVDEQIGLEHTMQEYIDKLVGVFMEVHRVLKDDGTLWLNIGDSYNSKPQGNKVPSGFSQSPSRIRGGCVHSHRQLVGGIKEKDLMGVPWTLAFALRERGWYLRQDIIWHKPNPMPESIKDRCTKSHEYIFLMSKSQKYYFDNEAIQEKATSGNDLKRRVDNGVALWKTNKAAGVYAVSGIGRDRRELYSTNEDGDYVRNKRDVWSVKVKPDSAAHFATYPEELIVPCILAGCPNGGVVLDPFMGSGTTARVARKLNRHFVGFELSPDYCSIIDKKIQVTGDLFY